LVNRVYDENCVYISGGEETISITSLNYMANRIHIRYFRSRCYLLLQKEGNITTFSVGLLVLLLFFTATSFSILTTYRIYRCSS